MKMLSDASIAKPIEARADQRSALERVRALRGVTWEWRHLRRRLRGRRRWMGVLAQDVELAFPEAVSHGPLGYLRVDYAGLVGALVEAIKELSDRIEALEAGQPGIVAAHDMPPSEPHPERPECP